MINVYLQHKRQFTYAQQRLDSELDLQWIHHLLAQSIKQAGFTPCIGVSHLKTFDWRTQNVLLPWIVGFQSIELNHMSNQFTQLKDIKGTNQLILANSALLKDKKTVLIADCKHAELLNISQVDLKNNKIILATPLRFNYPSSAYLGVWMEERWSIKMNTRGKAALYYTLGHHEELSSLVQSLNTVIKPIQRKLIMQITLGLQNGNDHQLSLWLRNS